MKIENLRWEKNGDRTRVAASVKWEDCNRSAEEVYFETEDAFSDGLACNPNAFLVGCIIPAMHFGENRIAIDAEICPELREGLLNVMHVLLHWYYPKERRPVRIDALAKKSDLPPSGRSGLHEGFFFSGGIDSFALLRANRLGFNPGHPRWIKDGFLVYGLEQDVPEIFEFVKSSLADAASKIGINLIPVYTNLYLNYRKEDATDGFRFWIDEFGGAALAAVAHAFSSRLRGISIAGNCDPSHLGPWGTHPLIDPNFSCCELRVRHECVALSRLQKTGLIADWAPALEHLRVCNQYKRYASDSLNCGKCEKCIRTMLELLAFNALEKTPAFPTTDVSPELVARYVKIRNPFVLSFYMELLDALSRIGRRDLVTVIKEKIIEYQRKERKEKWKKRFNAMDRQFFNSNLCKLIPGVKRGHAAGDI